MGAPGTTKGEWAVSKQKARRVTAGGVVICNAVLRNRGGPKHKAELKDEHEAEANAHQIAASCVLYDALADMLAGWKYIRQVHGDLSGVGWDRAQDAAINALALARGEKAS